MADIASLGVVVRPDGITQTEKQLEGLTQTGAKAERQMSKIAPAMDKTTLSAKQLAQATRGLPAQFTDIVTSLQGGQAPLQVLLQQGGQIKDQFGGAVPALRAVGGQLAGLINPITLTAGAVIGLGLAWKQANDEQVAFNQALILTGNSANTTAEELTRMSERLDDATSATQGRASEVLAEVANTGRFTAEQIELVTEAAIRMEDATGKAVKETIAEFVSLQRDPVAAILKLNEAQHFLTEETANSIVALEEQGRTAEAVDIAVRAHADNLIDRAPKVTESLLSIEQGWRGIKNGAKEAWDEIIQGFRDADRAAAEGIKTLQQYFSVLNSSPSGAFAAFQTTFQPAAPLAGASVTKPRTVDSAQVRAAQEFDKGALRFATERQRMEKDIAEARALGLKAGKSELEIEKRITAIRASYERKAPKARKPRAAAADPADGIISRIREQISVNEAEMGSIESLTGSQRLMIAVKQDLADNQKKVTAARKAEIETLLAELESSDNALVAYMKEAKAKEELARLTNELTIAEENRRAENEADLAAISGAGREEVDQMRRKIDIEREYRDGLRALRDKGIAEDSASYQIQEEALRQSRDHMLAQEEMFQRRRKELMGDWTLGANAAFRDFITESENVAGATYDIFSNAFDGLSDTLTDFITKGKGDFKGLLDSIAADITSFLIKQQLSNWLKSLMGGGIDAGSGETMGGLIDLFSSNGFGFASGGYTGDGSKFEAAGVVHKGEYVLNADATRMLPRGYLDRLNAGYVPQATAPNGPTKVTQKFTQVVQGAMTRRTAEQAARETGRAARRGLKRTGG